MKGVSPKKDVQERKIRDFFPKFRTKGCSANYALEDCFIQAACAPLASVSIPVLVVSGDWVAMG